jgi:pimeloyl-ACP methyl ester carboxylesterase
MTSVFVLVHGAWHGGWCWRHVARGLREAGHEVHTPTLTGLGERSHLLTSDTDLEMHVRDIVQVLEYEQLHDVHLVAHSYAGMPATLAAVEAPRRVGELICLDGFVPEAGEAAMELLPEHAAAHYRESAVAEGDAWVIPPRPLERLGVTDEAAMRWLASRLVPHPLPTYTQVALRGASELEVPGVYLQCTGWASPFDHMVTRAADLGWRTGGVDGDHEVMATAPKLLVEALLGLAGDREGP